MIRPIVAIFCALVLGTAPLAAAPGDRATVQAKTEWVGAWGFVVSPPPPGQATPAPNFSPGGPAVPLAAAAAPFTPGQPRFLDNPGRLPVDASSADLTNVTMRQLVRVSIAGPAIRLRLSNESGTDLLAIGGVHVGLAGPDGSILPGTDRVVTFAGNPSVNIPGGAPLLSDPVALPVKALDKLAVSIYAPGRLTARNVRTLWQYVAGSPGDTGGAASLPNARLARAPVILSMVEVAPTQPASTIVAFGDSITEGDGSTLNAFRGWPDRLAERLAAQPGKQRWAVVNSAISGNRLLGYGSGPNALARFDRDVLAVPGVKTLILLEGINDIGRSFSPRNASDPVTAPALIAAYQQIIARAHAHGIRVIAGLLTPYKGAGYASEQGEAVRQAVNSWIRTSGAFDGMIDFASAVADKADPLKFDAKFNNGDLLHPNDAGYQAMADAIDLRMLTGK